jgi:hypothetical protein
MELKEKAAELAEGRQDRRIAARLDLDEDARILLVKQGITVSCRVVDLSLTGCRMRTQERFVAGAHIRVEVALKVSGFGFRSSGVVQWTDGRYLVGIRFVELSERRRDELAEALREVKEDNAVKAAGQAAEKASPKGIVIPIRQQAQSPGLRPPPLQAIATQPRSQPVELKKMEEQAAEVPAAKPANSDRRAQARHAVDTSVVMFLIHIASRMQGRILDLSMGGCRIRTDERFPVGIYTRVEIEFRLEGLPFRLGGVIQAIHDRHHVGIFACWT